MSSLSISRSSDGDSRRKITVNERVERILHGALQDEPRTASADARNEDAMRRSRQLSNLYTSSMEDKFLRSRIQSDPCRTGPKSVPKHVHLAIHQETDSTRGKPHHPADEATRTTTGDPLPPVSPTKPTKCYAKFMLEQMAHQEDEERRKWEATQFRAPDFSPPKPWYKGYSSHQKAPVCTVDAKVRRYGAFGAIKMLASESASGTSPSFALNKSQSLDSLAYKDTPSAWSPSLHGSPSLWPEDANYPNGSTLETSSMARCPSPNFRFPSHVVGRTEPSPDDAHYARMQHVHAQDARELEAAFDEEKARRKREIAYNKEKFEHWKAKLHFEPLSSKMDHPFVKVNAKRGNELTILHTPEYSPVARFDDQIAKLTHERFALRWPNLALLMDVMKKTVGRRPVLQDIEKLLALSYEISLKNMHHLELNRQQFWELLSREYPLVDLKQVNRVFSSYDFKMEDRIDMRLFLSTVRAMRVQQGSSLEIITMALQDFDISKRQVVSKSEHFVTVMTMCCDNDDEEHHVIAGARATWSRLLHEFVDEKELRRQRRLRGLEVVGEDTTLIGDVPDRELTMDDEGQSEIESLLFVGRDDEPHTVPIKFVRNFLRHEKRQLQQFTDLLVKRREACSKMITAATPTRTRGTTPLALVAGRR